MHRRNGPMSTRFDITNPIFINHNFSDCSPLPARVLRRFARIVGPHRSIVVVSIGPRFLPGTGAKTASSILWFATVQCVEGKQDLADGKDIDPEHLRRAVKEYPATPCLKD